MVQRIKPDLSDAQLTKVREMWTTLFTRDVRRQVVKTFKTEDVKNLAGGPTVTCDGQRVCPLGLALILTGVSGYRGSKVRMPADLADIVEILRATDRIKDLTYEDLNERLLIRTGVDEPESPVYTFIYAYSDLFDGGHVVLNDLIPT